MPRHVRSPGSLAPAALLMAAISAVLSAQSNQDAAGPMQETTVLRIAHAYQQATDWHRRHPVLA